MHQEEKKNSSLCSITLSLSQTRIPSSKTHHNGNVFLLVIAVPGMYTLKESGEHRLRTLQLNMAACAKNIEKGESLCVE